MPECPAHVLYYCISLYVYSIWTYLVPLSPKQKRQFYQRSLVKYTRCCHWWRPARQLGIVFKGTWQWDRFSFFWYKSVRHRSHTQLLKPSQFWLWFFAEIFNRKSTPCPRIFISKIQGLQVLVIRQVGNSPYHRYREPPYEFFIQTTLCIRDMGSQWLLSVTPRIADMGGVPVDNLR
jgi:hypothetical protein